MKVRYVEDSTCYLTKGKIYTVEFESGFYYNLIDDVGLVGKYSKNRFEIVKENVEMKKSDLKNGMVVENREGNKYVVFKDGAVEDCIIRNGAHNNLVNFNEDLTSKTYKNELSIDKVYNPKESFNLRMFLEGKECELELLWERKDNSKEVSALKLDIENVKKTLKEMEDKLTRMESGM